MILVSGGRNNGLLIMEGKLVNCHFPRLSLVSAVNHSGRLVIDHSVSHGGLLLFAHGNGSLVFLSGAFFHLFLSVQYRSSRIFCS